MAKKTIPPSPPSNSSKDMSKPPSSSGCCMGSSDCATPARTTTPPPSLFGNTNSKSKTRIVVKYDVGFNNQLFIRGKGANLSWEKGIPLINIKNDEWAWETNTPFTSGEFKVLINDTTYEAGDNHPLKAGMNIVYTPSF